MLGAKITASSILFVLSGRICIEFFTTLSHYNTQPQVLNVNIRFMKMIDVDRVVVFWIINQVLQCVIAAFTDPDMYAGNAKSLLQVKVNIAIGCLERKCYQDNLPTR